MRYQSSLFNIKAIVLMLFCIISPFLKAQEDESPLTVEQKIADLALLWQEVNYNFVFFDKVPDLDWDATFQAYISKVMTTNSRIEHIRVLQQFIALLKEGHTNVVPPRNLRQKYAAFPPIELDAIEGKAAVVNVTPELQSIIPVGSVILAVDGIPTAKYLDQQVLPYVSAATHHDRLRKAIQGRGEPAYGLLVGEVGSQIYVTFEKPNGEIQTQEFTRMAPDAKVEWLKHSPESRPIFQLEWLPGEIAHVHLNGFHSDKVVTEFERALPELQKAKGLIFDVRKNGGGNSANGWKIGSYILKEPTFIGTWRARKHTSVYKAWGRYRSNPEYRKYFEGDAWTDNDSLTVFPSEKNHLGMPVVVLGGSDSYSATEDFLALMSSHPGATLIGGPSSGSTGQPLILELPGGAWAAIISKRDQLPNGQDIVGKGVAPDIEVYQSIKALREGRDLVLEKALEVLRKK